MLPGLPQHVHENIQHFIGRAWLLPSLLDWLKTDERLFLLTAKPGTGKSMITAWLAGAGPLPALPEEQARLRQVRGLVRAAHFFQAASGNTAPKAFAQNIAEQLTNTVPEFGDALVDALSGRAKIYHIEQNVEQAQAGAQVIGILTKSLTLDMGELGDELSFDRVLRDPLKALYKRGYRSPLLLVVDALDEAITYTGAISIPQLLTKLVDLPSQVRVLATTRPDPPVLYLFPTLTPVDLIQAAPANTDDVRSYVRARLGLPEAAEREGLADRLAKAADGNFLYAHLVLEDLLPHLAEVDDLDALPLPADLSELYQSFLNRRIGPNRALWRDQVRPLLGLVAVGQGAGLNRGQLDRITRQDTEGTLETWKQYLDGALPDGPFRPFHKSFADFLLDDARNQAYHVDGPRTHERLVDYYWPAANGAKPWAGWDAYARHYLPTHLADAAQGRPTNEGHPLVERLVRLMTNDEFQAEYRLHVKDLAALQADLDRTLRAAAADLDPTALRLIPKAAFALIDFRRRELRPEPLFAAASEGEVDSAAGRLDLFEADERWRQAARLALAWLGATVNATKARQVLDRLPPELDETLARLALHAEAAVGGPAVGSVPLRQPVPDYDLAEALVKRVEGQGVNVELLIHYGHTDALQDTEGLTKTGYLAEEDGPVLVSFAAANPTAGDGYFDRYLTTLQGYSYAEYRNQSLWFLLAEAVKHPNPDWVKAMTARMAAMALSPAGADFQEGMWITVLALQAAAGQPGPRHAVDDYARATYSMADDFGPSPHNSRYSDTYGSLKRRLVAFAQCFARLLNQPNDARRFMDKALAIAEFGFAGFQMPACLTVAESYQVSVAGAAQPAEQALAFARTAAHNVQDPTFCARSTARYNAMRCIWWNGALGGDLAGVVRRLAEDASTPEFAALHIVGERYDGRRGGGLPRPEYPGHATSLRELSDLYHRPLTDFLRLNHEFGWQADTPLNFDTVVRVPERGLATLIACRLSAAVLSTAALSQLEQVALIQALVPVAAANPTTLNTVLARLLLAAQPSDPGLLAVLLDLADEARSVGADSTSYPYHPGTQVEPLDS
jgi:hypothetical protein